MDPAFLRYNALGSGLGYQQQRRQAEAAQQVFNHQWVTLSTPFGTVVLPKPQEEGPW